MLGVWKLRQEGSRYGATEHSREDTLGASRDGIGAVQWFCTDEASVPFQWL